MATAQCSVCQENFNKEFFQSIQYCKCGYVLCQRCCSIIQLQHCPVCKINLCTSTCDLPNDFTKLIFPQIRKDSIIFSTHSNNSVQHQHDDTSFEQICKQLFSIKQKVQKKDNMLENLTVNEHDSDTRETNNQTIFSTNIDLDHVNCNNTFGIRKSPNSIGLFEDFQYRVICLILMLILLVLLIWCVILSFIKWNHCPGIGKLPLFLMVECSCIILMVIQLSISIFNNCLSYFHIFILVLGLVFQLAWSVPGYVWIYGYDYNQQLLPSDEQFCDYTLYTTAYWILNCSSLVNGLIFVCLCVYLVIISKPLLGIIEVAMISFISIFIAMILIGFLNINNCPFQVYLPTYLTVTGIFGLLSSSYIFKMLKYEKFKNYVSFRKTYDESNQLISGNNFNMGIFISYILFNFVWYTIGCVLVFGSDKPEFDRFSNTYCEHSLYMFVYVLLSILSIIICTILTCTCLFITMFVFAGFCTCVHMLHLNIYAKKTYGGFL